jgi:hypothetical protein
VIQAGEVINGTLAFIEIQNVPNPSDSFQLVGPDGSTYAPLMVETTPPTATIWFTNVPVYIQGQWQLRDITQLGLRLVTTFKTSDYAGTLASGVLNVNYPLAFPGCRAQYGVCQYAPNSWARTSGDVPFALDPGGDYYDLYLAAHLSLATGDTAIVVASEGPLGYPYALYGYATAWAYDGPGTASDSVHLLSYFPENRGAEHMQANLVVYSPLAGGLSQGQAGQQVWECSCAS